jgi:CDP-diacylglycerol--glycerol-3-phosphate 3-phosphatidyltransferase
MANVITLSRLLLLIVVIVIAYQPPSLVQFINVPLMILLFVTDALDGYIARKQDEVSLFGAMFDIAGDRIVEIFMWIVLADLGLIPIWVPLIFVGRGVIVDTIRASQAYGQHSTPFEAIRTPLGQWLVAGKFMRIFYAVLKAHAFCWLLLLLPLPSTLPAVWAEWGGLLKLVGNVLVYTSVLICIARGLPVVIEFVYGQRHAILGRQERR